MKNGMYKRKEFKVVVYEKVEDSNEKFVVIVDMDENNVGLPVVLTGEAANKLLAINENYLDNIEEGS